MDLIIVLDVSEEYACKSANQEDVDSYKSNTLPMLGYYDDRGRLAVVRMLPNDSGGVEIE